MSLDEGSRQPPDAFTKDCRSTATVGAAVKLSNDEGQPRSQASILTDIGKAHHLFHDEGGDAYACMEIEGHYEVFGIGSTAYRECLSRDYYRLTGKGPGRNAVGDAISTLTAVAKHDGPCEVVYLRTGFSRSSIVIDTGRADWECIEIRSTGWRITSDRIVTFRRSGKPTALPAPSQADCSLLWKYVNVAARDRPLIAGWLLSALRPTGPFPILLLIGEQGTGKSCASRTLKLLTDPSAVLLRSPPRDVQDLLVAARSSWVLALDNLSGAKPELSDALCRIATGGSLAGRTLYTNAEETLLEIKRPMILNGIDDLASRPDLADRCLHVELPPLCNRATEEELEQAFKTDSQSIFAALLEGVSRALRDCHIKRERLPRMADFAQWAAAGVPALGFSADEFLDAYRANQANAIESGLETSGLASALRKILTRERSWTGSAAELLSKLNRETGPDVYSPGWPRSAKGLLTTLRRLAPSLRYVGIEYIQERSSSNRYLTFTCNTVGQAPQASSKARPNDAITDMTLVQPNCMADAQRPDTNREGFEERAAILEFDAGKSRHEAERLAAVKI